VPPEILIFKLGLAASSPELGSSGLVATSSGLEDASSGLELARPKPELASSRLEGASSCPVAATSGVGVAPPKPELASSKPEAATPGKGMLNSGTRNHASKSMFHCYQFNQETFMHSYHRRSNVVTTFNMIKRKFGERLRSKTETAQINELLCKILCHNLCCLIQSFYELGISPTFWTE
jgi:hypothetical protein